MFVIVGKLEDGTEYYWRDCGNRYLDMSAWDVNINEAGKYPRNKFLQETVDTRLPDSINIIGDERYDNYSETAFPLSDFEVREI